MEEEISPIKSLESSESELKNVGMEEHADQTVALFFPMASELIDKSLFFVGSLPQISLV